MSAAQTYARLVATWRASVEACGCDPLELRAEAGHLACITCGKVVRERAQPEASCKRS